MNTTTKISNLSNKVSIYVTVSGADRASVVEAGRAYIAANYPGVDVTMDVCLTGRHFGAHIDGFMAIIKGML